MKIIFGLGNPGAEYAKTYHNLGYMVLDALAEELQTDIIKKGKKSVYGETIVNGEKVLLVKPLTFMNLSGECVIEYLNFYKCALSDVLVVYDDINVAKGLIKYKPKGQPGTHNGMRNITKILGSGDFPRLRVGSKNTNPEIPLISYVLSAIPKSEQAVIAAGIEKAKNCAYAFIKGKTDEELMCEFNGSAGAASSEK